MRAVAAATLSLSVQAAAVMAQTQCPDGTPQNEQAISRSVDRYFSEPFGARTWRVLNGLGEPGLEPSFTGESQWRDKEEWKSLVAKLSPALSGVEVGYSCRIGHALATLKQRVARLGENHPYVAHWIAVQSAVLDACRDGINAISLPAPLPIAGESGTDGELRSLQAFDRAYQQASLNFYRRNYADAIAGYRSIAQTSSPHRAAARYMVANSLANAGRLEEAQTETRAILADPSISEVHAITQELTGYIANLTDDAGQWSELLDQTVAVLSRPAAEILASPKLTEDYRRALYDIDYLGVRRQDDDWWLIGRLPENATRSKALYDGARRHPMVVWLIAGQSLAGIHEAASWQLIGPNWRTGTAAYAKAARQLTGSTGGLAWEIFAAQTMSSATDDVAARSARLAEMSSRVMASCGTAPETAALGTWLHHTIRLLVEKGDFPAAYRALQSFPLKDTVAFHRTLLRLGQYLAGTGRIEEGRKYRSAFLQAAERERLVRLENSDDMRRRFASLSALFAADMDDWLAAIASHPLPALEPLFNLLPQKLLAKLSADATFAEKERALFARVAWTRAYLSGYPDDPALTKRVLELNSGINAVYQDVKQTYGNTNESRRWLLTVLRTPRLGILTTAPGGWDMLDMTTDEPPTAIDAYDHNDKNWWCPFNLDRHLLALRETVDHLTGNGAAQPQDRPGTSYITRYWYRSDDWFRALIDPGKAAELDAARERLLRAHPAVQMIDWKELARLRKAPSAPKLLSQRAVQWARRGGKLEDGVGEALSLSLRAARYGCNWAGSHRIYTQASVGVLRT
ncbi:MAG: hypothetical protein ACREDW_10945, partial [Aestuariivirgaceae bacterium]